MLYLRIYKIFNLLYNHFFIIYKPLYFIYKNIFEKKQIVLLKNKVKPGMNVLDIGANIGFYSLLISKLVGESGRVYSFEPDKLNYKYLKQNTNKVKNIIPINAAVGAINGTTKLYISQELNVDHHTYDIGEKREYTSIKLVTIDDYFKDEVKFNVIKLDIQGYDYYAVLGMIKTIKKSKNVLLVGEYWPYGLKKAGVNPKEYLSLIKKIGFKITFYEKEAIKNKDEKLNYKDFYAVKGSI